jgi:aldehyde:ferredoxin oxidoreductase
MECFQNGLLTAEDTGGLELRFGNAAAMVALTRMICERQGLGDLLAEGPTRAASQIGRGAEGFVLDVKKQPFPMHECRARHGQALGYAVSPTGAEHIHNMWDDSLSDSPLSENWQSMGSYQSVPTTELNGHKVRAFVAEVNWRWFKNTVGCCGFLPWSRDQFIEIVRAVTGWNTNHWEALKWGERGVTMARAFNLREGLTRGDDVLPPRVQQFHVSQTLNEAPVLPDVLDRAVSLYYGMMGWDPQSGVPTEAKLHELDVAWIGEQLPRVE